MTSPWRPYREPLRNTVRRTGMIAILIGAVLALFWGGFHRWPLATLLALWPSFGGHWIEVCFLNLLRPRLPRARAVQISARILVWFAGGVILETGMRVTAATVAGFRHARWPQWWVAGLAFTGVELIAHVALQMRRLPGFFNGRG